MTEVPSPRVSSPQTRPPAVARSRSTRSKAPVLPPKPPHLTPALTGAADSVKLRWYIHRQMTGSERPESIIAGFEVETESDTSPAVGQPLTSPIQGASLITPDPREMQAYACGKDYRELDTSSVGGPSHSQATSSASTIKPLRQERINRSEAERASSREATVRIRRDKTEPWKDFLSENACRSTRSSSTLADMLASAEVTTRSAVDSPSTPERSCIPSIVSGNDSQIPMDWILQPSSGSSTDPNTNALPTPSSHLHKTESKFPALKPSSVSVSKSLLELSNRKVQQPKSARALYQIDGIVDFGELRLSEGQHFEVLQEGIAGGWVLGMTEGPSLPGALQTGLVPEGWFVLQRESFGAPKESKPSAMTSASHVHPHGRSSGLIAIERVGTSSASDDVDHRLTADVGSSDCTTHLSSNDDWRSVTMQSSVNDRPPLPSRVEDKSQDSRENPLPLTQDDCDHAFTASPVQPFNAAEAAKGTLAPASSLTAAQGISWPAALSTLSTTRAATNCSESSGDNRAIEDLRLPQQRLDQIASTALESTLRAASIIALPNLSFPCVIARSSAFANSGAESYLLISSRRPRLAAEPNMKPRSIVFGPYGDLQWEWTGKRERVQVHEPYIIERSEPAGWFGKRVEKFIVYQVTTVSVIESVTSGRTSSVYHGGDDNFGATTDTVVSCTVSRRYNHFVYLYTHLRRTYPLLATTVIPSLPPKVYYKHYDATFLYDRAGKLERWLQRVSRHSVLRQDAVMTAFLQIAGIATDQMTEQEASSLGEWEQWIAEHERHLKEASTTAAESGPLPSLASRFFEETLHPAYAVDFEQLNIDFNAFEKWQKVVEGNLIGGTGRPAGSLLSAFHAMQQDMLRISASTGRFGESLQRLLSLHAEDDEEPSIQSEAYDCSREGKSWCWKEECSDCLDLTRFLQYTAEAFTDVADLQERHAKGTLPRIYDRLKEVGRPHTGSKPLLDIHRRTMKIHQQVLDQCSNADASATSAFLPVAIDIEEVESRSETILSVLSAEVEHQHASKLEDWKAIGLDLLEGQICMYEEALSSLRSAREALKAQ